MAVIVSSDPGPNNSCAPTGRAYSCMSSAITLAPGQSHTEQFLVNFDHTLPTSGPVEINATKELLTSPIIDNLSSLRPTAEIHQTFRLTIGEAAPVPASTFAPFVAQLDSPNPIFSQEAARILATLAPASLEPLLLTFPNRPDARQFAPLALHNLNTPASLSALAQMLVTNEPGTSEFIAAAGYLAETHDPAWFPLLRQIALDHPQWPYLSNPAEVGGTQALPMLEQMLQTPNQQAAVAPALGATGSSSAIPILIALLRSHEPGTAQQANFALQQLTHLRPDTTFQNDPAGSYPAWSAWWAHAAATAHLYKPHECAELQPLR